MAEAGIIHRAEQARLALDIGQGLALVPGVVAQGDAVRARVVKVACDLLGDAEPAGDVLGVHHHEIELEAAAQARQVGDEGVAAGATDDVSEKS